MTPSHSSATTSSSHFLCHLADSAGGRWTRECVSVLFCLRPFFGAPRIPQVIPGQQSHVPAAPAFPVINTGVGETHRTRHSRPTTLNLSGLSSSSCCRQMAGATLKAGRRRRRATHLGAGGPTQQFRNVREGRSCRGQSAWVGGRATEKERDEREVRSSGPSTTGERRVRGGEDEVVVCTPGFLERHSEMEFDGVEFEKR